MALSPLPPPPHRASRSATPNTVLLIGGDVLQNECPPSRLAQLGFRSAGFARNLEEALQLTRTHRPDAILIDFDLTATTCLESLADRIQKVHNAPMLFLINESDTLTLTRAQSALVQDCISKPLTNSDLKASVRMAIYHHNIEIKHRLHTRLLEATNTGVFIANAGETSQPILEANAALPAVLRVEADALTGRSWRTLLNGTHPEQAAQQLFSETAGGRAASAVLRHKWSDGTESWLKWSLTPIRESGPNPTRWIGSVATLSTPEAVRLALIMFAPDSVIITDERGCITEFNSKAEALFGWRAEEILGLPADGSILPVPTPENQPGRAGFHRFLPGTGETRHTVHETTARKRDGTTFPAELSVARIADAETPLFCAFLRDITARKRLEAERQSMEARLFQSQKMESIGRLAGGIAHDFNNLLAAIQSFTELTQSDLRPDDPSHEYLRQVLKASAQARDLVKQILTYSRQKPQPRKAVSLQPMLKEAVKLLRSTLPANIEASIQIQTDAPLALADPTQIYEVIMHLGINAWHAMPQRGRLTVSLDRCVTTAGMSPDIAPADLPPGEYLRLSVADNGCGMDKATLERIFEPFFTTKPVGQGTGMGLCVVLGIIKSHQGGIAVESKPGAGTTVRVYLPSASAPVSSAPVPAPVRPSRGNGERVMLVDDETSVGQSIRRILERLNYHVSVHDSAESALVEFRADPKSFTVVITDYCMPGMSGVELAQEVRALHPSVSVVLTTGLNPQWTDEELKSMGIHFILAKPATSQEISTVITQAVQAMQDAGLAGTPAATPLATLANA